MVSRHWSRLTRRGESNRQSRRANVAVEVWGLTSECRADTTRRTDSEQSVNVATRKLLPVPFSRTAHCRCGFGRFAVALPVSAAQLQTIKRTPLGTSWRRSPSASSTNISAAPRIPTPYQPPASRLPTGFQGVWVPPPITPRALEAPGLERRGPTPSGPSRPPPKPKPPVGRLSA